MHMRVRIRLQGLILWGGIGFRSRPVSQREWLKVRQNCRGERSSCVRHNDWRRDWHWRRGAWRLSATIAAQKVTLGTDPYTGRELSADERWDIAANLLGGIVGGGLAMRGPEVKIGNDLRIAPLGNRSGHPTGELPHYHRRVADPDSPGQGLPGQGIGRHRPWDTKGTDRSFLCRF